MSCFWFLPTRWRGHGGRFGNPFLTIDAATAGGADISLNTPYGGKHFDFLNTIDLAAGANLYGGFDGVDWSYDPVASITPIMVNQAVALKAVLGGNKTISGISLEAKAPADGKGGSPCDSGHTCRF